MCSHMGRWVVLEKVLKCKSNPPNETLRQNRNGKKKRKKDKAFSSVVSTAAVVGSPISSADKLPMAGELKSTPGCLAICHLLSSISLSLSSSRASLKALSICLVLHWAFYSMYSFVAKPAIMSTFFYCTLGSKSSGFLSSSWYMQSPYNMKPCCCWSPYAYMLSLLPDTPALVQ